MSDQTAALVAELCECIDLLVFARHDPDWPDVVDRAAAAVKVTIRNERPATPVHDARCASGLSDWLMPMRAQGNPV